MYYFTNTKINPFIRKIISNKNSSCLVRHYSSVPPIKPDDKIVILAAAALVCGIYYQNVKK